MSAMGGRRTFRTTALVLVTEETLVGVAAEDAGLHLDHSHPLP